MYSTVQYILTVTTHGKHSQNGRKWLFGLMQVYTVIPYIVLPFVPPCAKDEHKNVVDPVAVRRCGWEWRKKKRTGNNKKD